MCLRLDFLCDWEEMFVCYWLGCLSDLRYILGSLSAEPAGELWGKAHQGELQNNNTVCSVSPCTTFETSSKITYGELSILGWVTLTQCSQQQSIFKFYNRGSHLFLTFDCPICFTLEGLRSASECHWDVHQSCLFLCILLIVSRPKHCRVKYNETIKDGPPTGGRPLGWEPLFFNMYIYTVVVKRGGVSRCSQIS